MLTNREYECVVHGEPLALRLDHVNVVALRVGRRVSRDKVVRRVVSSMDDRQGKRHRVRYVSDAVHESAFAGVNLEHSLTLVSW